MKRFLILAGAVLAAQIGAVSLAAEGTPPQLDHRAMDKLGWKLGSQAYTFRALSAFETLDTVRSLGLKYIEFYPGQRFSKEKPDAKLDHNMSPELLAELQAKLKETGIQPMNYGVVGLSNNEEQNRKVFEWAKKLGIKTIVSEPAEDCFELLDRLCGEYDMSVAIHDHPKPSRYWNPDTVLKVSEGRSKRIGACADTGHWYRSDLVPLDCLKKLEGRIISLHVKDLSPEKRDVPWGTGQCNARGMLEELKRQNFKGVFSIEYETGSGAELLANVQKCVAWFNEQAKDLAK